MQPGAPARPDPGRWCSTIPPLTAGATPQDSGTAASAVEVHSQTGEVAQIQSSMVRLRVTTRCKSTGVDAQPKTRAPVLFTQHISLQEWSLPASLNLKDKQPNLHSKNVRLPPQRTEKKRAGDKPVFSCTLGLRNNFCMCFADEAPVMSLLWLRVGFET